MHQQPWFRTTLLLALLASLAAAHVGQTAGPRRYGFQFQGGSIGGSTLEVVGVEPGSIAERGGVQAGDRILQMNGKPLEQLAESDRIAALRGSPLTLQVQRGERTMEIRLSLDGAGAPSVSTPASAPGGWTAAPAATPSASPAKASRFPPPPDAQIIPVEFVRNIPVVSVELNGKGPYRMFLDTGAQGTVLDASLAEELNLEVTGDAQVSSPGGQPVPAKRVMMNQVKLGEFVRNNIPATSLDRSMLGGPDVPRGVLSANAFMEGSTITIHYPARQVWIVAGELPPADGREVFDYGAQERLPVVTLQIGGKDFKVHLDSGAPSGITLPLARAAELTLEAPPVVVGRGRRVDREVVIHGAKLKGTVRLGRYTFENPDLRFDESVREGGTIGFGVLQDFVVTLDKKNRRIRLQQ